MDTITQQELDKMTNDMFYLFDAPDEKSLRESFLSIEFDQCIPLGMNCNSSSCLRETGNRYFKLPFDWMQATITNYHQMIQDMKNETVNCEVQMQPRVCLKHYDAWIPHEPPHETSENIKSNYIKYFKRLHLILNNNNNKLNPKNICMVITSFEIQKKDIVSSYKQLLNELYPHNNYFFLTCNIGEYCFTTRDHINIVNKRVAGYHIEDKWIGNIYNEPLFHFFKTYVSSKKVNPPV